MYLRNPASSLLFRTFRYDARRLDWFYAAGDERPRDTRNRYSTGRARCYGQVDLASDNLTEGPDASGGNY